MDVRSGECFDNNTKTVHRDEVYRSPTYTYKTKIE